MVDSPAPKNDVLDLDKWGAIPIRIVGGPYTAEDGIEALMRLADSHRDAEKRIDIV